MKKQKLKISNQILKRLMLPSNLPGSSSPFGRGLWKVAVTWAFVLLSFWLGSYFWVNTPGAPIDKGEPVVVEVYDSQKVNKWLKKLSELARLKAAFSTNLKDQGGMVKGSSAMESLREFFKIEYESLGTVRTRTEGGCYYWIIYQSSDKYVIIAEPNPDLLQNESDNVDDIKWRFIPGHQDKVGPQILDEQRAKKCVSILARYEKDYKKAETAIIKLFSKEFEPPLLIENVVIDAYVKIADEATRTKKFGSSTPSSAALTAWLNEGCRKVDQYQWELYHNNDETFYLLCLKEGERKALYDGDTYEDNRVRIDQQLAACQPIEAGRAWEYWVVRSEPEVETPVVKDDVEPKGNEADKGFERSSPDSDLGIIEAIVKDAYNRVMNNISREAQFGNRTPTSGELTTWLNMAKGVKDYTWALYYDVNNNVCLRCSKNNKTRAFYIEKTVVVEEKRLSELVAVCNEVLPNMEWEYWKPKIVPPTPLQLIVEKAYSRLETVADRTKKFGSSTPSGAALTAWLNEGCRKIDQYQWELYHNNDETFYLLCLKEGERKALYDGDTYEDNRVRIDQQLAACQPIEAGRAWEYWIEYDE